MSILNFLAALALMYVLWTLTVKRGMKNLTCCRSFSRPTAFEGEEGELVEVVRNDGPYIIPWLRVESYISPKLQLGKQENLHVSSDTFYRSCFALMPYQQIRRRHHVRFLVLARMKRKYDTARYYESVALLQKYFPSCAVTTDMIVAFPGETEAEFAESLAFIRRCGFADMHIFP